MVALHRKGILDTDYFTTSVSSTMPKLKMSPLHLTLILFVPKMEYLSDVSCFFHYEKSVKMNLYVDTKII